MRSVVNALDEPLLDTVARRLRQRESIDLRAIAEKSPFYRVRCAHRPWAPKGRGRAWSVCPDGVVRYAVPVGVLALTIAYSSVQHCRLSVSSTAILSHCRICRCCGTPTLRRAPVSMPSFSWHRRYRGQPSATGMHGMDTGAAVPSLQHRRRHRCKRTGRARPEMAVVCHRPLRVRRPRAPPRRALAAARQGLPARQPRGRRRRASPVTLARGPSLPLQMTRRRHGQRALVFRPPAADSVYADCRLRRPLGNGGAFAEGSMCCSAHSASPCASHSARWIACRRSPTALAARCAVTSRRRHAH